MIADLHESAKESAKDEKRSEGGDQNSSEEIYNPEDMRLGCSHNL